MLVLSRRTGEEVIIASNIRVTVLAIRGNRVHLGFSAPDSAVIVRSELASSGKRPNDGAGPPVLASSAVLGYPRPLRRARRICRLRPVPKERA